MRNLQTPDIFAFVRMLNKIGIKDELKAKAISQDANVESLGYDIIFMVLEKLSDKEAESEIYTFFAPIFETSEEELKSMDAIEFLDSVTKIASIERWKAFFSSVAKLMK